MEGGAILLIAVPGGVVMGLLSALVAAGALRGRVTAAIETLTEEVRLLRGSVEGDGGLRERITRLEAMRCLK